MSQIVNETGRELVDRMSHHKRITRVYIKLFRNIEIYKQFTTQGTQIEKAHASTVKLKSKFYWNYRLPSLISIFQVLINILLNSTDMIQHTLPGKEALTNPEEVNKQMKFDLDLRKIVATWFNSPRDNFCKRSRAKGTKRCHFLLLSVT